MREVFNMNMVFTKANILFLFQGLKLTLTIAVISIFLSMIFGVSKLSKAYQMKKSTKKIQII